MSLPFRQVDVFSPAPLRGNPVAVVHDADDLTDEQMAAFARWTNLSETTFLLRPTDPAADYRVRIFAPGTELPFAGHPTLGTAHGWLEAGGVPNGEDVVQECGVGLVRVRRAERLGFAAPPLTRSGRPDPEVLAAACRALRIAETDVLDASWLVNGPQWVGLLLRDADAVLALEPDMSAFAGLEVGAIGLRPDGDPVRIEVRAFGPDAGFPEDPVTGSLNGAIAQWLTGDGTLPASYVAAQGTVLGRVGRVHIDTDPDGVVWVSGDTVTRLQGVAEI